MTLCVLQCDKHSPAVIQLLCDELAVEPTQILDFELFLSDAVPAVRSSSHQDNSFQFEDDMLGFISECPSLELVSPWQIFSISLCGIF